jgi:acyl-CoA thioester hydrolase
MASVSEPKRPRVLVYQTRIALRWGDMDAMGHLNNTVYFRLMEECRIQWFHDCGFAPNPQGQGPVIINASCTFIKQFEYPATVVCRQYLGQIGRSSFETEVDLMPASIFDSDPIYCKPWAQGAAKCVWVDFPKGQSAALAPETLAKISRAWSPSAQTILGVNHGQ